MIELILLGVYVSMLIGVWNDGFSDWVEYIGISLGLTVVAAFFLAIIALLSINIQTVDINSVVCRSNIQSLRNASEING